MFSMVVAFIGLHGIFWGLGLALALELVQVCPTEPPLLESKPGCRGYFLRRVCGGGVVAHRTGVYRCSSCCWHLKA